MQWVLAVVSAIATTGTTYMQHLAVMLLNLGRGVSAGIQISTELTTLHCIVVEGSILHTHSLSICA